MRKKMLEEIISDYGIDGNVVNDLAKAIREYYKEVVWSEKFHRGAAETLESKLLELEATSGIKAVGSKTTFNKPPDLGDWHKGHFKGKLSNN